MKLLEYSRELVGQTIASAVFLLGLVSTAITFLPGIGVSALPPQLLRSVGFGVMILSFGFANYKVYAKQLLRIQELQAELERAEPPSRENDVDAVRNILLRLWRMNPNPIGRHIPAALVIQHLGWDEERFNAAALRAAGEFGSLRIAFDGRLFLLQQIPI